MSALLVRVMNKDYISADWAFDSGAMCCYLSHKSRAGQIKIVLSRRQEIGAIAFTFNEHLGELRKV